MKSFVFETWHRTLIILSRKQSLHTIPAAIQNSKMPDHSMKRIQYRHSFYSQVELHHILERSVTLNKKHQSRRPAGYSRETCHTHTKSCFNSTNITRAPLGKPVESQRVSFILCVLVSSLSCLYLLSFSPYFFSTSLIHLSFLRNFGTASTYIFILIEQFRKQTCHLGNCVRIVSCTSVIGIIQTHVQI